MTTPEASHGERCTEPQEVLGRHAAVGYVTCGYPMPCENHPAPEPPKERRHSPGPCPSDVGQVCWECNDMPEPPAEPPLEGTVLRTLREVRVALGGHAYLGPGIIDAIERVTRLEAEVREIDLWAKRKQKRRINESQYANGLQAAMLRMRRILGMPQ